MDSGNKKSCVSIKWLHFVAWLVEMKLGASPLSAQWLWLIKADQQSMSWRVFSSLLELFFLGCHISIAPVVFSTVGLWQRHITLLRNVTFHSGSIQLRATRNVSRTCPAHRSFFFFFSFKSLTELQSSKHWFVNGLWFLLAVAFPGTFLASPAFFFCCPADFVGFLTG